MIAVRRMVSKGAALVALEGPLVQHPAVSVVARAQVGLHSAAPHLEVWAESVACPALPVLLVVLVVRRTPLVRGKLNQA